MRGLALAVGVRLAAALAKHRIDYGPYLGADAGAYHRGAQALLAGAGPPDTDPLIGTRFVKHLLAAVYSVIGPRRLGGSLVFALAGLGGSMLFGAAFKKGQPGGDERAYGRLVLFLPSLAYWPSGVGKDALMQVSLGAGALGTARAATDPRPHRGLALATAGGALGSLVRPHVTAVAATSSAVALAAAGRRDAAAAMGSGAAVLALIARRDLRRYGFGAPGGAISHAAVRTGGGGSDFDPLERGRAAALAGALLRPHPLETHNAASAAAAAESTLLAGLAVRALARRRPPRSAYALHALACTGLLMAAFSGIANRGLLTRQRAQLLPFYLVLVVDGRT